MMRMDVLKPLVAIALCLAALPHVGQCVTLNDSQSLYNNLMTNYIKDVRPILNQSDALTVNISFILMSILDINDVEGTLTLVGSFRYNWLDQNMIWSPASYGGATSLFAAYKNVWIPELVNMAPADDVESIGESFYKVRYLANGLAILTPTALIKSSCTVNVKNFPFDEHTCSIALYAHGYSPAEIYLHPVSDTINITYMQTNSEWDLTETSVENGITLAHITFNIRVKRKAAFAIVNVILPITFLGLLNVLVFLLVPESGERVSYCITVLLSISVFMTITSDTLPKSSEPVPIISYKLMVDVVISMLITLVTILNLRIHNKGDDQEITPALKKMYLIIYCKTCTRNKIHANDVSFMKKVKFIESESENKTQHLGDNRDNRVMQAISELEGGDENEVNVSWKDIAAMFDFIFLIFFTNFVMISFVVFLYLVTGES